MVGRIFLRYSRRRMEIDTNDEHRYIYANRYEYGLS